MNSIGTYRTLRSTPWRMCAWMYKHSALFSHISIAFVALFLVAKGLSIHAHAEQSTMCLAEDLYHEGRGEGAENMRLIGKIMLARVLDSDRQWPKSICGAVAQDNANSWVLEYRIATKRDEQRKWEEAQEIARDLLREAQQGFTMPKGWECARYYKLSEWKSAFFKKALVPVAHGEFGHHTAYREKGGCKLPMPTT